MAKTIGQLTALGATPEATDELVIADGGVTKKISVSNLVSAALNLSGNKTVFDGVNLVLGTTTGTKLGTAVTQKLGFWNVTPVVQPAAAAQAAAAAQTQTAVTDSTGGAVSTTLAAITAPAADATTSLTAYMTPVNNAVASMAAHRALIKTDVANVKTLQDATRTALVNTGIMKGAA